MKKTTLPKYLYIFVNAYNSYINYQKNKLIVFEADRHAEK